jgi:hypothetical protein
MSNPEVTTAPTPGPAEKTRRATRAWITQQTPIKANTSSNEAIVMRAGIRKYTGVT